MMGILSGWGTKIMSMKDGQFLDIRHFSFDCAIGTSQKHNISKLSSFSVDE